MHARTNREGEREKTLNQLSHPSGPVPGSYLNPPSTRTSLFTCATGMALPNLRLVRMKREPRGAPGSKAINTLSRRPEALFTTAATALRCPPH